MLACMAGFLDYARNKAAISRRVRGLPPKTPASGAVAFLQTKHARTFKRGEPTFPPLQKIPHAYEAETMNNKTLEIWSMTAAVNVQNVLPLIETQIEKINVQAMAARIQRKYKNAERWNCLVENRCEPEIKTVLMLQ